MVDPKHNNPVRKAITQNVPSFSVYHTHTPKHKHKHQRDKKEASRYSERRRRRRRRRRRHFSKSPFGWWSIWTFRLDAFFGEGEKKMAKVLGLSFHPISTPTRMKAWEIVSTSSTFYFLWKKRTKPCLLQCLAHISSLQSFPAKVDKCRQKSYLTKKGWEGANWPWNV